jgi:hypothetical protein
MQARRLVAIMQARRRCYLLQLCSGRHRAGCPAAVLLRGCLLLAVILLLWFILRPLPALFIGWEDGRRGISIKTDKIA